MLCGLFFKRKLRARIMALPQDVLEKIAAADDARTASVAANDADVAAVAAVKVAEDAHVVTHAAAEVALTELHTKGNVAVDALKSYLGL